MSAACRVQYEQWLSTREGERPAPRARSSFTSQQGGPEPASSSGNSNDILPPTPFPSLSQLSSADQGKDLVLTAADGSSNDTPSSPPPSSQPSSANQERGSAPAGGGGSPNDTPLVTPPHPQKPPHTDGTGLGRSSHEPAQTRYLLWCVNLGRSRTVVEKVSVAGDHKDKEVFNNLRHVYNETRGWWRTKASLHILAEIRYVKVSYTSPLCVSDSA